jgi:signal transduction histidine kinase
MRRTLLVLSFVLATSGVATPEGTRQVLLVQSFARGFEPHSTFSQQFQTKLAGLSPQPVEFSEIFLPMDLEAGGASETSLVGYLKTLEDERRFDLVVTLGGPATRFVQRHRAELLSKAPMLIAGVDRRHLDETGLSERDAVVPMEVDIGAVFENILRVLPETTTIVLVFGASPHDRFWNDEALREAGRFADRVKVTSTVDLTFDEICARAAALPPKSAIFYRIMARDAAGVPHADASALAALRKVTHAPIFGLYDFQLGHGIVGGPLISLEQLSAEAARAALDLLAGRPPSEVRRPPIGPGNPTFDDAELTSWKIPASRLPAGSTILFRPPSFWAKYKGRLIAIGVILAAQTALIVFLLVQRRRRREAEEAVRDLNRRLVDAQEEERRRLGRELHDDVTQRLAGLSIDVARLDIELGESPAGPRVRAIQEGLSRASEDAHALAYRMHPSLLEDLGLPAALQAECEEFSQRSSIHARLSSESLPATIPSAVALCLYRVAQEALRNAERHSRARSVEISLRGVDGRVRLSVKDDGVGMTPDRARGRASLGFVSMRERVAMHGGELDLHSAPGRGTTVTASVPLF